MLTRTDEVGGTAPRKIIIIIFYPRLSPRQSLIARTLKQAGFVVTVLAWDRMGQGNDTLDPQPPPYIDEWRWVHVQAPLGNARVVLRLAAYYRRLIKLIRTYEKGSIWILTHLLLLPAQFFCSGKRIYDAAELYAVDLPRYLPLPRAFSQKLLALIEGVLVRPLDGILATDSKDEWLGSFYRRWNSHVQVLWNVPSREDEPPAKTTTEFQARYAGRPAVALVGGLSERKGLWVALRATALVSKVHPQVLFLLIGALRESEQQVEQLIDELKIRDNVCILPWMSYPSLLAHLKCATVGLALYQRESIFESLSSGNGRKIFTYMQAGIPIVAPDFGELGTIVSRIGCGILADTTDPKAVSDSVCHYLRHSDVAAIAGGKGRSAFEEQFNWENEIPKLLQLIGR